MGRKKSIIKGRKGVGNPEALREAYERLEWLDNHVVEDWEKELVSDILDNWDKISEAIDTALLNHGFRVMTMPITKGEYSVFLRFGYSKLRKRWVLTGAGIGQRVGWGFKWEFMLDRMQLIRRDRETKEVVAY